MNEKDIHLGDKVMVQCEVVGIFYQYEKTGNGEKKLPVLKLQGPEERNMERYCRNGYSELFVLAQDVIKPM